MKKYTNKIPKEHLSQINKELKHFKGVDLSQFKNRPYPTGKALDIELAYIKDNTNDSSFAKKHDDLFDNLELIVEANGYDFNKKEVKELKEELDTIIYYLKYHYNRPRPYQVDKLKHIDFKSAKTPSYPSGHSTQSAFFSKYFIEKYPELEDELTEFAINTGKSRITAGVHYPSDHDLGKEVGNYLYEFISNKYYKGGSISKGWFEGSLSFLNW